MHSPLAHVVNNVVPRAAKPGMAAAQLLVIDEATALSAYFFTRLDALLKEVRDKLEPFGGLVVLLSGEFLQVCPARGQYAFASPACERTFGKETMVLSTTFRNAGDPEYPQLLLWLRLGTHTRGDLDLIASRQTASPPPDCNWLFCTGGEAVAKDNDMLAALHGPDQVFVAVDTTREEYLNDVQAGHLLNYCSKYKKVLTLRVGARVRVPTKALAGEGIVSGSHGQVIGFSGSTSRRATLVVFQLLDGSTRSIAVGPAEAHVMAFDGVSRAGTCRQIPLVLAWASKVHSAQVWTLDRMAADQSEAFAPGQVLSALSRTRRLGDNFLVGFDEDKVLVSPQALTYYSSIIRL